MRAAAIALLGAACVFSQTQRIERWELRPAADGLRLYVYIDGEDEETVARDWLVEQGLLEG